MRQIFIDDIINSFDVKTIDEVWPEKYKFLTQDLAGDVWIYVTRPEKRDVLWTSACQLYLPKKLNISLDHINGWVSGTIVHRDDVLRKLTNDSEDHLQKLERLKIEYEAAKERLSEQQSVVDSIGKEFEETKDLYLTEFNSKFGHIDKVEDVVPETESNTDPKKFRSIEYPNPKEYSVMMDHSSICLNCGLNLGAHSGLNCYGK